MPKITAFSPDIIGLIVELIRIKDSQLEVQWSVSRYW